MKKIIAIIIAFCLIESALAINIEKGEFIDNNILSIDQNINKKLSDFYEKENHTIVILIEEKEHSNERMENTLEQIKSKIPKEKCAAVISYVKDFSLKIELPDNCIDKFSIDDNLLVEKLKKAKEAKDEEKLGSYNGLLDYATDSLISSFSEDDTQVSASKGGYKTMTKKGLSKTNEEDVKIKPLSEEKMEEQPLNPILLVVIAIIIAIILIPIKRKKPFKKQ